MNDTIGVGTPAAAGADATMLGADVPVAALVTGAVTACVHTAGTDIASDPVSSCSAVEVGLAT